MKDYYKLFVEYSVQQCTKGDYRDPQKVESHNLAAKKLKQLQAEMQVQHCYKILEELLNHKSDAVRVNAASMCIDFDLYTDKTVTVLKDIICHSNDPFAVFSAKMLLSKLCIDI